MSARWHLSHKAHGDRPWAVQAEAMRRADGRPRFGQWLEMGLGKTALAMNEFVDAEDVDLNIVISPQSFKLDWKLAPAEWGLGFMKAGMWPNDPLPFDWDCGQYAINYEAASRSKAAEPLLKLLDTRRCMVTIDESKALGNPGSGFTKSIIEVAKRAKRVRELNGTPITQNVMDYYGQLRALGELDGVNPVAFRNRYAILGGFMGKAVQREFKNGEELGRILDGCSFRALKADWRKDLPPKTYSIVHVEMTDQQRSHYQTMMEEFYVMVRDDDMVAADMVAIQMGKLRQIAGGFILDGDKVHVFEKPADNPKIRAVLEIVDNPGKTIVAHYHRASGKMLIEALQKAKFNPAYIQGGMQPAEVVEQKNKFNTDPTCRALVGQERATALGHTLIGASGDRCTRTCFFENSYSYYYRSQLEDRNHRGDQDEACQCIDIIGSPIDQTGVDILLSKRNMAGAMDEIVKAVRLEHDRRRR